jgi:hypothetical protein
MRHRDNAKKDPISSYRARIEKTLTALANIPDLSPVGTVTTGRPVVLKLPAGIPSDSAAQPTTMTKEDMIFPTSTEPRESIESIRKRYPELFANYTDRDIVVWRDLLRAAWNSSDPEHKAWFVFVLRNFHAKVTRLAQAFRDDAGRRRAFDWRTRRNTEDWLDKLDDEELGRRLFHVDDCDLDLEARAATPPPQTKVEELLAYLQRNLDRFLKCRNQEGPEPCPAPYFFRSRKGQETCSAKCAAARKRRRNNVSAKNRRKEGRKT